MKLTVDEMTDNGVNRNRKSDIERQLLGQKNNFLKIRATRTSLIRAVSEIVLLSDYFSGKPEYLDPYSGLTRSIKSGATSNYLTTTKELLEWVLLFCTIKV